MTYTIEVRDGHHIVDMNQTNEPSEAFRVFETVLKAMTGVLLVEAFIGEEIDLTRRLTDEQLY